MAENRDKGQGEVLFEYVRVGAQMRVSAIDAKTGTEVVIVAPANAPRHQIQQVAMAKLRRKLNASG
jgi:hypothetical protein